MARAILNRGELAGIRLVADLFVIRELEKNVLAKNEHVKPHIKALNQRLKRQFTRCLRQKPNYRSKST